MARATPARRPINRRSKGLLGALLVMTATTVSERGRAGDPPRLEGARQLFREGVELSERGSWQQAADKYAASLELKRSALTVYSLAVTQRNADRPVEALEGFVAFLAEPTGARAEVYRQAAEEAVSELKEQLGRLIVRLSPKRDVEMEIDGKRRCAVDGTSCYLRPGAHTVVVKAQGLATAERRIHIAAGEVATVELVLHEPQTPMVPMVPIVLVGTGSASFTSGLIVGVIGFNEASSPSSEDDSAARALSTTVASDVLMASGLAAAAVGVVLWALEPSDRAHEQTSLSIRPWSQGPAAGVELTF